MKLLKKSSRIEIQTSPPHRKAHKSNKNQCQILHTERHMIELKKKNNVKIIDTEKHTSQIKPNAKNYETNKLQKNLLYSCIRVYCLFQWVSL